MTEAQQGSSPKGDTDTPERIVTAISASGEIWTADRVERTPKWGDARLVLYLLANVALMDASDDDRTLHTNDVGAFVSYIKPKQDRRWIAISEPSLASKFETWWNAHLQRDYGDLSAMSDGGTRGAAALAHFRRAGKKSSPWSWMSVVEHGLSKRGKWRLREVLRSDLKTSAASSRMAQDATTPPNRDDPPMETRKYLHRRADFFAEQYCLVHSMVTSLDFFEPGAEFRRRMSRRGNFVDAHVWYSIRDTWELQSRTKGRVRIDIKPTWVWPPPYSVPKENRVSRTRGDKSGQDAPAPVLYVLYRPVLNTDALPLWEQLAALFETDAASLAAVAQAGDAADRRESATAITCDGAVCPDVTLVRYPSRVDKPGVDKALDAHLVRIEFDVPAGTKDIRYRIAPIPHPASIPLMYLVAGAVCKETWTIDFASTSSRVHIADMVAVAPFRSGEESTQGAVPVSVRGDIDKKRGHLVLDPEDEREAIWPYDVVLLRFQIAEVRSRPRRVRPGRAPRSRATNRHRRSRGR